MDDKIRDAFTAAGIGSEIPCEKAFTLAEKYGIPKMEIAKYCNKHKIKIRRCQLGCFK